MFKRQIEVDKLDDLVLKKIIRDGKNVYVHSEILDAVSRTRLTGHQHSIIQATFLRSIENKIHVDTICSLTRLSEKQVKSNLTRLVKKNIFTQSFIEPDLYEFNIDSENWNT